MAGFTAADFRAMATRARQAAESPHVSGESLVHLGPTNLRIRFSGGTYVARGAGIVASCTAGPVLALKGWATKADAAADAMEAAS